MALCQKDIAAISAMIAGAQKAQEAVPPPAQKTPAARKQNRAAVLAATTAPATQGTHECANPKCGNTFTPQPGTKTRRCRTCIDAGAAAYKRVDAILDSLGISRDEGSQVGRMLSLLRRDYEGLPQ